MMAISTTPLTKGVTDFFRVKAVNTQPNGLVTISFADDQVMSVQPGGSVETRPAGTAGVYEVAYLDGQVVTFCPDGMRPYPFAFVPRVPNT